MNNQSSKKAIVLLSGGLDSTTLLALALSEGYNVYALSFDYGQRHKFELESAKRIASSLGVIEHKIISIDLRSMGGSALTDDVPVPEGRSLDEISVGIPVTYVPARNTIFLSFALAWAEVVAASVILIGVNAIDYSGYPDCRPEFIRAFQALANCATKRAVEGQSLTIETPFIHKTKSEIIKEGLRLGVDYGLTHSCYQPDLKGNSCGICDSCMLRKKGFAEAHAFDPLHYNV